MEGVLIASGPAVRTGASLDKANLLDIAPTVLHLLGVPVPADLDGRVLSELFEPAIVPPPTRAEAAAAESPAGEPVPVAYSEEEDAAIQQRLADLGYL
jgi:arylsulfatase A-like enzyme